MRSFIFPLGFVLVFSLTHTSAWAQTASNRPKIAYAYPAGGERGTTVDVMLGGRQIARADRLFVSGEGVSGTVIAGYGSTRINNSDERNAVRRYYLETRLRLFFGDDEIPPLFREQLGNPANAPEGMLEAEPVLTLEQAMRKFPYLDKLENPTNLDLQRIFYEYFHARPDRLPKETMAQAVFVRLTISPDALPGDRELYLATQNMVTSPIRFVVGTLPEVSEIEPNDTDTPNLTEWLGSLIINGGRLQQLPQAEREKFLRRAGQSIETLDTLTLPVVVNGQIRSGDVDRFRFHAVKGQKLVIAMQARHLIPYLADAVPGWFQGMLTLYSPTGQELESATSYRFEPDPLMGFEVPSDGVYTLEVRDTLFRGRDDFVYRISMGETPLLTSVFPLGGQIGTQVSAELQGWNLPTTVTRFDTAFSSPSIQQVRELGGQLLLRPIRYAVDSLPEIIAPESSETPVAVTLPVIINGRIMTPTGVDSFQFTGQKDQTIVCDVAARSLDSMLDGVLELLAPDGTLLAQNDDRADSKGPNIGLETHHADPYLFVTLPADGTYTVRLYNAQQRGGAECAYRLRISPPRPGFSVYCTPSALALTGTSGQRLTFNAVRHDGFDGDITMTVPSGTPFQLSKAVIPAGEESVTATLSATNANSFDGHPRSLALSATGQVGGRNVVNTVTACEDHEQAFIYHHLIPTANLTIFGNRWQPPRPGGAR